MNGRNIVGCEDFSSRPPAYPQGLPPRRQRGGLGRWLAFLALVWLPFQPFIKRS